TVWTPPGFSRWYFNFTARTRGTAQPPPGFSRWYFNFTARTRGTAWTPPGFSGWYFTFTAKNKAPTKLPGYRRGLLGGESICNSPRPLAMKLKNHRLKRGGVLECQRWGVAM